MESPPFVFVDYVFRGDGMYWNQNHRSTVGVFRNMSEALEACLHSEGWREPCLLELDTATMRESLKKDAAGWVLLESPIQVDGVAFNCVTPRGQKVLLDFDLTPETNGAELHCGLSVDVWLQGKRVRYIWQLPHVGWFPRSKRNLNYRRAPEFPSGKLFFDRQTQRFLNETELKMARRAKFLSSERSRQKDNPSTDEEKGFHDSGPGDMVTKLLDRELGLPILKEGDTRVDWSIFEGSRRPSISIHPVFDSRKTPVL